MQEIINQMGGWVGLFAALAVGGYIFIERFNNGSKELRKEESDTAKDVIELLSSKVNVLEGKVEELETRVEELTTENKTLRDVLQGRDGETKQFYKDAYAAIEVIKHNDTVSEENSKTLSKIATLLETVIKTR